MLPSSALNTPTLRVCGRVTTNFSHCLPASPAGHILHLDPTQSVSVLTVPSVHDNRLGDCLLYRRRGFHLLLQARLTSARSGSTKKGVNWEGRLFSTTVVWMDRSSFIATTGLLETRPLRAFHIVCPMIGRAYLQNRPLCRRVVQDVFECEERVNGNFKYSSS